MLQSVLQLADCSTNSDQTCTGTFQCVIPMGDLSKILSAWSWVWGFKVCRNMFSDEGWDAQEASWMVVRVGATPPLVPNT